MSLLVYFNHRQVYERRESSEETLAGHQSRKNDDDFTHSKEFGITIGGNADGIDRRLFSVVVTTIIIFRSSQDSHVAQRQQYRQPLRAQRLQWDLSSQYLMKFLQIQYWALSMIYAKSFRRVSRVNGGFNLKLQSKINMTKRMEAESKVNLFLFVNTLLLTGRKLWSSMLRRC